MSRQWLIAVLFFVGVFVFSSQGLKGGPEVSIADAVGLLKGNPRPVVIDVRDSTDYELGHLTGAISVPFAEFKERLPALKLPKADAVVLYGADEARARDATRLLYENGYHGALTLKGGIDAWRTAGHATEKSQPARKP